MNKTDEHGKRNKNQRNTATKSDKNHSTITVASLLTPSFLYIQTFPVSLSLSLSISLTILFPFAEILLLTIFALQLFTALQPPYKFFRRCQSIKALPLPFFSFSFHCCLSFPSSFSYTRSSLLGSLVFFKFLYIIVFACHAQNQFTPAQFNSWQDRTIINDYALLSTPSYSVHFSIVGLHQLGSASLSVKQSGEGEKETTTKNHQFDVDSFQSIECRLCQREKSSMNIKKSIVKV